MIRIVALIFCLIISNVLFAQSDGYKETSVRGVLLRWKVESGTFYCQVKAPAEGWVAVGLKNSAGIVQSNLLMGCFRDGSEFCEDHYVVDLGNYPQVEELGGMPALETCEVYEESGTTTFIFSMPSTSMDGYHYNLVAGEKIFITIAYSRSDDFSSHSVQRFQMQIVL